MQASKGFTGEQQQRYLRSILLPGFGTGGQKKLLRSSVLLVGAGGLGSPAALYLAASGVGRIGLVDGDHVSLSNLQRQILHATPDLGRPKVDSAGDKLKALNPGLKLELYRENFSRETAGDLVGGYDFIVDCTDNLQARYMINETCVKLNKPFVYGGVLSWAGQVFTILPGKGPCFSCIFPDQPAPAASTSETGVLGVVTGVIGAIQASEAIRYILGLGELLVGRILTFDALSTRFYEVEIKSDPDCPVCASAGRE